MIAWAFLPVIVLYSNCLIGGKVSVWVFLRTQKSAAAIDQTLGLHILDALTKHNLVRLLLCRCRSPIPTSVLRGHIVISSKLLVYLRGSRDAGTTRVQVASTSIEGNHHFLIRAHVVGASIWNADEERVVCETLMTLT